MVLRISGLASGMDIDSIVKDLMRAERIPLDKLNQKKQTLEWQRDDYRTINALFFDFRSLLTDLKMSTQYRVRNTVSTNENLLTATASSAASLSSNTIEKVTQLASAATRVNSGSISKTGQKIDPSKSLYSQNSKFSYVDGNNNPFTWSDGSVESKSVSVSSDQSNYVVDLGTDLKSGSPMNVKVNGTSYTVVQGKNITDLGDNEVLLDQTTGKLTFKSVQKNSTIKVDYVNNSKQEKVTLPEETKEFQLTRGAISSATVTLDGKNYVIDETVSGDVKPLVEKDADGNVTGVLGRINVETGIISLDSSISKEQEVSITYSQKYTTFSLQTYGAEGKVNQENFFVNGTDSINTLINKVNSSSVGVSMFYDTFSDQLTLTRKESGDFNKMGDEIITGSDSNDFLNGVLKFSGSSETGGENAVFQINGLQTERYSNTFEINGVTFTIKQKFDEKVSISVKNDTDKVFENIKNFVDKYNTLIDTVNKKISEERYRDYTPLTDDQREQLSDKQQEQWEEKAKSGLLKGDSILSSALTQMRMSIYQPVENSKVNPIYKQLASIGITTTANYLEGGKLEIDEAKLKAAIQDDPESVENLFNGTGPTASEQGIIQKLYANVSGTIDKLNAKAGKSFSTNQQFSIGKSLDDVEGKIDAFKDRLTQIEDRYYRQFTAMEQAIQKSNSQMSYLMQYFGGGQ